MRSLILLGMVAALAAFAARAQQDPSDAALAPTPATPAQPAEPPPPEVDDELLALDALRAFEARLSAGETLSTAETSALLEAARSRHLSVRALAAAVLAWLDPATAAPTLLGANAQCGVTDPEARVRVIATQSLLALSRRLPDELRRDAAGGALLLLDDPADEVACAGAELALALAPSAVVDAVRVRANNLGDVRYACFSRIGGLPVRAVEVPDIPRASEPLEESAPSVAPSPPPPATGTWIAIATTSSAGFLAGALVPTMLVPGRDVLTYRDDSTRITREELSVITQAAGGLAGAAAFGVGTWAVSAVLADAQEPLSVDDAGAVALGTGALGLVGAALPVALDLDSGTSAGVAAAGLAVGAAGTLGLVAVSDLDKNDGALALGLAGLGAMAGGLAVFTAVPVGLQTIGGADRTSFGFATAAIAAGSLGFAGLAAGTVVDLPAGRTFATVAGGLIGGGLMTGAAFLLTPDMEVKSRVACGVGLAGELAGASVGFLLVPDAWVGALE